MAAGAPGYPAKAGSRLEQIRSLDAAGIGGPAVIAQRTWLLERVDELAQALRQLTGRVDISQRDEAGQALMHLDELS